MAMKLNRRLNIVLNVERSDGSTVHVHSEPIAEETFDRHYLLLTSAVARQYRAGIIPSLAIRNGLRMLRSIAKEQDRGDKDALVERSLNEDLLPEIRRRTNVIIPSKDGWLSHPYDVVRADPNFLTPEDTSEIENYLCFFTSASWAHQKQDLEEILYQSLRGEGVQFTSLNCTEYKNSLQTLKQAESSGEKVLLQETSLPAH